VLRRHRIKSRNGVDLIDAVIGRLQAATTETIRPVGIVTFRTVRPVQAWGNA
jgi:hypothetical protein